MKAYKIEVKLNKEQEEKFKVNESICRFLYNEYIMMNEVYYINSKLGNCDVSFISGFDFDKYVNNELCKDFKWIKNGFSKARKKSIMNAETAFKRFFKGISKYPKYKKKKNKVKVYLPKNGEDSFEIKRHKVKVPLFGWVRLKEFGYLPLNCNIKSASVSQDADKYFISFLTDEVKPKVYNKSNNKGIGIDLGIKDLAITSDGNFYRNINKDKKVKELKKKLRREQRSFDRKIKNKKTEVNTANKNIEKNKLRIQKLYMRLKNIRKEYIRYVVNDIVKQESSFITLETLNISGMMKNRHLSKAIQEQCLYYLKSFLIYKCNINNIEVREVDRFYPSSKLCSNCGNIKNDLTLSDRVYKCEHCGFEIDRDLNASLNLEYAKDYIIIK